MISNNFKTFSKLHLLHLSQEQNYSNTSVIIILGLSFYDPQA